MIKNPDIISLTKLCAPKPIATDAIPALATILVVLTPSIDNTWKNAIKYIVYRTALLTSLCKVSDRFSLNFILNFLLALSLVVII